MIQPVAQHVMLVSLGCVLRQHPCCTSLSSPDTGPAACGPDEFDTYCFKETVLIVSVNTHTRKPINPSISLVCRP